MLATTRTGALLGVDAVVMEVEADCSVALPGLEIVGLPPGAAASARVRVHAALKNTGYALPQKRTIVNLAPAELRKTGTAFDLPIALSALSAAGGIPRGRLQNCLLAGELGLSGEVRPVRGALVLAAAARRAKLPTLLVPAANAREAAAVQGVEVLPVRHLGEAVAWARGEATIARAEAPVVDWAPEDGPDLIDVRGQLQAREALEIAAAGGHHILMMGPPGCGKSMLARRLPGLLPALDLDEALESTAVHSVAGKLDADRPLMAKRPFRAPHHTISMAGLVGGGPLLRPGEASLAHNGVLFLDELAHFHRQALDSLRQPIEDRRVLVARAAGAVEFPCNFLLVAAMNPCACGLFGGDDKGLGCRCTPHEVHRYRARVSGPLMDRFDLHVTVGRVPPKALAGPPDGEPSERVRARVEKARAIQRERLQGTRARCNAEMTTAQVRRHCRLGFDEERMMTAVLEAKHLSARARDRILKVARTRADLKGRERIEADDIGLAAQYRELDRVETSEAVQLYM